MRIKLDNSRVRWFAVTKAGRIYNSGDNNKTTWQNTFIDLEKMEIGSRLIVSFNKLENEAEGMEPVYVEITSSPTEIMYGSKMNGNFKIKQD